MPKITLLPSAFFLPSSCHLRRRGRTQAKHEEEKEEEEEEDDSGNKRRKATTTGGCGDN